MQELLGHASVTTTQRYTHLEVEDLQEQVAEMPGNGIGCGRRSPRMAKFVCPPWIGYFLASPVRRLVQKPERILAGFVAPGMTVLEVGPGMGFFSLPLAQMAGSSGAVICVDVQQAMLRSLRKRAEARQLGDRIITRVCLPTSLGLTDFADKVDFALAFAVIHELSDVPHFFTEVAEALRRQAQCLVAEPKGHVSAPRFAQSLETAHRAGLAVVARPRIWGSHAALLRKAIDY